MGKSFQGTFDSFLRNSAISGWSYDDGARYKSPPLRVCSVSFPPSTFRAASSLSRAARQLLHDELHLLRAAGFELHGFFAAELRGGEDHFAVANDGESRIRLLEQEFDGLAATDAGRTDIRLDDELTFRGQD